MNLADLRMPKQKRPGSRGSSVVSEVARDLLALGVPKPATSVLAEAGVRGSTLVGLPLADVLTRAATPARAPVVPLGGRGAGELFGAWRWQLARGGGRGVRLRGLGCVRAPSARVRRWRLRYRGRGPGWDP